MSTNAKNRQAPTQLALLEDLDLPLQFRLDQRTRERGLAHVAAIKAQLAARAVSREQPSTPTVPAVASPANTGPSPSAPARRRAA